MRTASAVIAGVVLLVMGVGALLLGVVVLLRRSRPSALPPASAPVDESRASEELRREARRFEDLFEPLCDAAQGVDGGRLAQVTMASWRRRIGATGSVELMAAFAVIDGEPVRAAAAWFETLRRWGVVRDGRAEVRYDEAEEHRYDVDGSVSAGALLRVVEPCWTWGSLVIQRGVVAPREGRDR